MYICALHMLCLHRCSLLPTAVNISFQAASMTVREDVGVLSLQLVSSGAAYTSPFSVSVVCSESDPVQAEGTLHSYTYVHRLYCPIELQTHVYGIYSTNTVRGWRDCKVVTKR